MPSLDHLGEYPGNLTQRSEVVLMIISVLCSEMAVKLIDEPFISATDDKEEWAL
jgi:hypothetical protein